jgi:hypothetical protein
MWCGGPALVLVWIALPRPYTLNPKNAVTGSHSSSRVSRAAIGRPLPAPQRRRAESVGANWAGYVVNESAPYISAQGTWTVPKATYAAYPGAPQSEVTSTWIGIGGFNEPTLIQLGTSQVVNADKVEAYGVWYEVLPAVMTGITATRFVVGPGDKLTASIQCTAACTPNAQSTWILSMTNEKRWTSAFTIQLQYPSSLASAEWIMEDTCVNGCSDVPADYAYLPDYGSTTFSAISANNANPNLSRAKDALMVTDPQGKTWSVPSDPIGGNSFTVSFGKPGPH